MSKDQIKIPCPHETHGVSVDETVSDYYPLSYTQMRELILLAFNDHSKAAAVQCRLDQAIEGMVCPREIDGPVARKGVKLDSTFVKSLESGDVNGAIEKIGAILDLDPSQAELSRVNRNKIKQRSGAIKKLS